MAALRCLDLRSEGDAEDDADANGARPVHRLVREQVAGEADEDDDEGSHGRTPPWVSSSPGANRIRFDELVVYRSAPYRRHSSGNSWPIRDAELVNCMPRRVAVGPSLKRCRAIEIGRPLGPGCHQADPRQERRR